MLIWHTIAFCSVLSQAFVSFGNAETRNAEILRSCRRQSRGNLGREGGSHQRSNARPEQFYRMHEFRMGQRGDAHLEGQAGDAA
jgi:hypothetical protein